MIKLFLAMISALFFCATACATVQDPRTACATFCIAELTTVATSAAVCRETVSTSEIIDFETCMMKCLCSQAAADDAP